MGELSASAEAALLRAASAGDGGACRRLVELHLRPVHRLAQRMLDDPAEAEDVAQDLFLRLWQAGASWREGEARLSTWIHTVTLNLCRDRLRRRRPQQPLDDAQQDERGAGPGQRAQLDERESALRRALAELPQRQREALLLFHYQGLSQVEAAQALGVSEDALESLLARARRGLKARLIEHREAS
ncbi:MAG: sigma-70 family RNA polymerase sigma factor [Aquimonas sp.]|nr:sigma-70 family RNA polymerase sigma factor [Aquimonas sp.]